MVVSYADPAAAVFYQKHNRAHTLNSVVQRKKSRLLRCFSFGKTSDDTYEKLGWSW